MNELKAKTAKPTKKTEKPVKKITEKPLQISTQGDIKF